MAKTKKDEEVLEVPEDKLKGKDLEKAAEAESLETAPEGVPSILDIEGKKPKKVEKTKEDKLKALKEKAEKILKEKVEKTDTEINFKQEFATNLFSYELFIVNYLKILLQFKYDLEQIEDKYKLIKISSESQNSKKFNSMTRYLILFLIIN